MVNISIIIPFYKGEKYLSNLVGSLYKSILKYNDGNVEVIIMNDYPSKDVDLSCYSQCKEIDIRVVNNDKNYGIQKTRINGLKIAKYEYILFLDQDDIISESCLKNQASLIGKFDVIISNGIDEKKDYSRKIYKTLRSQKYATKEAGYLKVRDLIVSPGQCLIKKESIPSYWMDNIMKINCADDFFLWLLMFNDNKTFTINPSCDFIHKYTNANISANLDHVHDSNMEMIDLLSKNEKYSKSKLTLLNRSLNYKYSIYKKDKILSSFKNLDLFIYNCIYQILWKGM